MMLNLTNDAASNHFAELRFDFGQQLHWSATRSVNVGCGVRFQIKFGITIEFSNGIETLRETPIHILN